MFLLRKKKKLIVFRIVVSTLHKYPGKREKKREDDNKSSDSVFSCDKGKVTAQKTAKAQLRSALKRVFFFLPKGPLRLNKLKQKKGRKKKDSTVLFFSSTHVTLKRVRCLSRTTVLPQGDKLNCKPQRPRHRR